MAVSQQYQQQLEQMMQQQPNFLQEVTKAYEQPVLRPIVDERAGLEAQYLPNIFNPLRDQGTGAADMSPEAKLSAIGGDLGRLGGRIQANQNIQDFYRMNIGQLADQYGNQWNSRYGYLRDMYDRALAEEEANKSRAAQASMYGGGGGSGYGDEYGYDPYAGQDEFAIETEDPRRGSIGGFLDTAGDFARNLYDQARRHPLRAGAAGFAGSQFTPARAITGALAMPASIAKGEYELAKRVLPGSVRSKIGGLSSKISPFW